MGRPLAFFMHMTDFACVSSAAGFYDQQIGQGEQAEQLRRVLAEAFVADLAMAEQTGLGSHQSLRRRKMVRSLLSRIARLAAALRMRETSPSRPLCCAQL